MQFQHLVMDRYRISFLIFFQVWIIFCPQCDVFYKHISVLLCHSGFDLVDLCPSRPISLLLRQCTKDDQYKIKGCSFLNSGLFPEFTCSLFNSWTRKTSKKTTKTTCSSNHATSISHVLDNALLLGLICAANAMMTLSSGFRELTC